MFLYEKSLVLCKKQQENTGDYVFKIELPLDGLQIDDEKAKQNRFCLRCTPFTGRQWRSSGASSGFSAAPPATTTMTTPSPTR